MDKELEQLLSAARQRTMSPDERDAQRINFAYGNASEGDTTSTIETVKAASTIMKAAK